MRIAVTGGKGGTGKSTIAINLAAALVKQGKSVTLIDADVDCPNDHLLLGARLENRNEVHSFVPKIDPMKCTRCGKCAEVCAENALFMPKEGVPNLFPAICSGCEACRLACPEGAISGDTKLVGWTHETTIRGIRLVTGELKPSEPLSAAVVAETKRRGLRIGNKADIVIVDTAAGTHCDVVLALHGSEKALIVTEPTPFGMHDLEAIRSVLKELAIPCEVVLNRSDIGESKGSAAIKIPYDEQMIECYIEGIPLVEKYPENAISKEIEKWAQNL